MRLGKGSLFVAAALTGAGLTLADLRAGGDLIAFPEDYAQGVMYMAFDHTASKTSRELYANRVTIDALRSGATLPSGAVLTSVAYKIKLDDKGEPLKDENGRFQKTSEIAGYTVMEKRAGWGSEYPDDVRNGEWEYQAFAASKDVNSKANLKSCFACHKPHANQDYLFTLDKLRAAAAR